jgi:hypothetical protein
MASKRVDIAHLEVMAIMLGKVMIKTKRQKFHHTIRHTNLKRANLSFVWGNSYKMRFYHSKSAKSLQNIFVCFCLFCFDEEHVAPRFLAGLQAAEADVLKGRP